ncbi:MAG: symmetrical bis(5'-nucleosyl)-tetraphosphatase [Pseudomonadota bacterium]
MATYAIGDLQGCWRTLQALLVKIRFRRGQDTLWFVGDLVNRGEGSLECLRFVQSLGKEAVVVLGNHDLHLLAVAEKITKPHRLDTLDAILEAPDGHALLQWLRQQKLLHVDDQYAMVHAGLMPQWSWRHAQRLAGEIENKLRGRDYRDLLANMYGDEPSTWKESLRGHHRMRFILNTFTRMRTLTQTLTTAPTVTHNLQFKGALAKMPSELTPWFDMPTVRRTKRTVIAGHWSTLGLYLRDGFVGLDTGCVWGQKLSAYRLEDGRIFQMRSQEKRHVDCLY